jgi:hypothetical protein
MPCAPIIGSFNSHSHSTSLAHYPYKPAVIQLRRGGRQLCVNAERRHNARINPPADITPQGKSYHPMFMKDMLRRVGLNELLGCAAEHFNPPLTSNIRIIIQRIKKSSLSNAILHRSNAKYLFKMAEQTTWPTAAKSLLFTKAANLKLTDTINRSKRPMMQSTKMHAMYSFRSLQFLIIPLHNTPLSGSAPSGALPW